MTSPAFEFGIQKGLELSRTVSFDATDPAVAVVDAAKGSAHEGDITKTLDTAEAWRIHSERLIAGYQGIAALGTSKALELGIMQATINHELDTLINDIAHCQELVDEASANEQYSKTELVDAELRLAAFTEQANAFYETLIAHINDVRTVSTAAEKNSKLRTIGIAIDDMTKVDEQGESSFSKRMQVIEEAKQDRNVKKAKHDFDAQQLQLAEESYAMAVSALHDKRAALESESDIFKRRTKEIDKAARHATPKDKRTKWLGLVALGEPRGEA